MSGKTGKQLTSIWDLRGTTLVITEKPKVAKRVAEALSYNGELAPRRMAEVPYYELRHSLGKVIIASAAGHLFSLYTESRGYPVFDYKWVPSYLVNSGAKHTSKYLRALKELSAGASYYVNACDYDIEGSVIGYMIIKSFGREDRAFRAKFSSLTTEELRKAFQSLSGLDYEMIEAGLCRHELDWIWGINVSRALMRAVRAGSGRSYVLSAGRVQTPTLKHVVEYLVERNSFVPLPLFNVKVEAIYGSRIIELEYEGNPLESYRAAREIADRVKERGYLIVEEFESDVKELRPPPPFNLGDLQEEAARVYGFSPSRTQSLAEDLYYNALISYPRTNSQKLPPTLNYAEIIKKLGSISADYQKLVTDLLAETGGRLRPAQGAKEDPAHPAIYPTGVKPEQLSNEQWKVYNLIVRRFLAAFSSPAQISYARLTTISPGSGARFVTTGQELLKPGWIKYYNFIKVSERPLPQLSRGAKLIIKSVSVNVAYTRPPKRLSKVDILRWMEGVEIGTESTRAMIIEKLFERKYLESTKKGVEVTDLGYGVVEVLEGFFPDLVSVELTRKFEKMMEGIRKGIIRREVVVKDASEALKGLLAEFDSRINEIGSRLSARLGLVSSSGRCSIPGCNREAAEGGLCKYHREALLRVEEGYGEWNRRKPVSRSEYLSAIMKMESTGKWAKDVIKHVLLAR